MSEADAESRWTESDEKLFDVVARRVVQYRMEVPAVLFLESVRPMNFVGSQTLVFFAPLVQAFFPLPQYERFAKLLEDRDNLDRLARCIEREADRRRVSRDAGSVPKERPKDS